MKGVTGKLTFSLQQNVEDIFLTVAKPDSGWQVWKTVLGAETQGRSSCSSLLPKMQSVPASDPIISASASLSSSFCQTSDGKFSMFSLQKTEGHYMAGTRQKKVYLQCWRTLFSGHFCKQKSRSREKNTVITLNNGFKRTDRKTCTRNLIKSVLKNKIFCNLVEYDFLCSHTWCPSYLSSSLASCS